MNKYLVICFLIFSTFSVSGQKQYDNTFKLHTSAFYIADRMTAYNPLNQLGVSYERRAYQRFFVSIGYHQWQRWQNNKYVGQYEVEEPYWAYIKPVKGTFLARRAYKMADMSILYRHGLPKKHTISGGLGVSYCWGENEYVDRLFENQPLDQVVYTSFKKVGYWGIVPQLTYDYALLNNHLTVGADIRNRFYVHRTPVQLDYGVHVGVNF